MPGRGDVSLAAARNRGPILILRVPVSAQRRAAHRSSRCGRPCLPRSPGLPRPGVRPVFEIEGDDADPVGAADRPTRHRRIPGTARKPLERVGCQRRFVAVATRASQSAADQRSGAAAAIATAPTTFGLPASSRSGSPAQRTSVGRDDLDSAAARTPGHPPGSVTSVRRARRCRTARTSCAPRARRNRDAPDRRPADVDPAMRRQLRSVDEDPRADGVRFSRQPVDGLDVAGDVRGAGDRQQGHTAPNARSSRSTWSSSSRPSGRPARERVLAAPRHGRSFE